MDPKVGDRVRRTYGDRMEGVVVIAGTTAPDAYGDHPVAVVEWQLKGEKVRTFAPMTSLEIVEEES